ncbi:MAG: polysaccharide biosynthesis protein [bacterium]|nr:polysaccharide biosynthesis protein [bacterium]
MQAEKQAGDSPLKRLAVQTSHYGITSLITMLAGLVTFPLLTRVFSVADYGAMNLIAATVTISVALAKLGVQHSILRYYSEISSGKGRFTMPQLVSTTFLGMVATGLIVVLLLVLGTHYAPVRWLGDEQLRPLFAIASLLILVQVVESGLVNFLRAEQRTTAFMKYQVAKKGITLAAIVVALLIVSRSLRAFYAANVLAETLAVGALAYVLFADRAQVRPSGAEFSRPLYKELVLLGIPMMVGYEMSSLVLSVGDRYVISGMIGEQPLGLYAAAYNLCVYVQQVAIASIGQAIMPLYMQMWDQKGPEQTSSFVSSSLTRYMLFSAPVVAGLAAVGPELLPSLASEKYASAAVILPWVIAGMVVDGSNAMLGAGLFIHRKTKRIMSVVMSGAVLNIALNVVLVPRIGILGSAIATLVSYAGTALGLGLAGRRLLPVKVRVGTLVRASLAALVMYLAVHRIFGGHRLATVGVRTVAGVLVYGAIMLVIDRDARELANSALSRFRR